MSIAEHFERTGIVIVEYALQPSDLDRMTDAFSHADKTGDRHAEFGADLLHWLERHPVLSTLAEQLAGAGSRLVRVIAFDKTPRTNWFVPWHQDRSIAVARRLDCEGYGNWTSPDGEIQIEPPISLLESMVTLRVHLDDCDEDNGPLEVVLGSHRHGRMERDAVAALAETGERKLCLAVRGDILATRPLLIHRSQKAKMSTSRRVLHLDYASAGLGAGLSSSIDAVAHT